MTHFREFWLFLGSSMVWGHFWAILACFGLLWLLWLALACFGCFGCFGLLWLALAALAALAACALRSIAIQVSLAFG